MKREISITAKQASRINNTLAGVTPNDGGPCETWTARFEDGCEADIKVVYDADEPYIDPVLFDQDGHELLAIQDCSEHIEGTYQFDYAGKSYIVEIRID